MSFLNLAKAGLSTILRTDRAWNAPVHLQIEPTTSCNLKCRFCNRAKMIKTPKQLKYENFKAVYDQVRPLKVSISGRGEPLLSHDLCRMIAYAKGEGSSTTITTNFTLGADHAVDLVDSGIDSIRVSIETSNPEVYKNIRGADLHGRVLSGIAKINDIKRREGRGSPHIGFEVVMTKDSMDELEGIISLAKEYDVQRINLRTLDIVGVEEKQKDLLFSMTKEELCERMHAIRQYSHDVGVKTNVDELLANISFVWGIYQGLGNDAPDCIYPWLQIYVNVDGEVAPCCALNTDEDISMGNVFDDGFVNVWNAKRYMDLRRIARKKTLPFRSCARCPSKGLKWFAGKYRFLKL